jgi:hypothetical protein
MSGVFVTTVGFVGYWQGVRLELSPGYLYGIRDEDIPGGYSLEEGIDGYEFGDIRIVTPDAVPTTLLQRLQ